MRSQVEVEQRLAELQLTREEIIASYKHTDSEALKANYRFELARIRSKLDELEWVLSGTTAKQDDLRTPPDSSYTRDDYREAYRR